MSAVKSTDSVRVVVTAHLLRGSFGETLLVEDVDELVEDGAVAYIGEHMLEDVLDNDVALLVGPRLMSAPPLFVVARFLSHDCTVDDRKRRLVDAVAGLSLLSGFPLSVPRDAEAESPPGRLSFPHLQAKFVLDPL
ncbi:hypothetical protein L1887_40499 [Cichorium endivia]|nr:hypothetical protein L1887_40499 [Cichorium endivia]